MDSRPLVFDVSSDEEGWGETTGWGGGCGAGDDCDWISEFFGQAEKDADDSDDVVLVGEVVLNPKRRSKSSIVAAKPFVRDLDDDCVVLDGDPDKPVVIENSSAGDSDDLLIVSEKGQIACRDYPHPRHLCAKFAFTSTPHERHCHQCHCYVCDSLAPCITWGNGTSSVDHCHATDRDEFWKHQRRNLKQGDKPPVPVQKFPDNSLSVRRPNSLAQNQSIQSRLATIRACSTSTSFRIPTGTNQGRSQQSVHLLSRNKIHPNLVSQQLDSTHSNKYRRERGHNFGLSQSNSSHTVFKRAGSPGLSLATNRCRYGSSNNGYGTQYSENASPVVASNNGSPSRWQELPSRMSSYPNAYQPFSQQNTSSRRFGNSVPSQPHVSSHPNMHNAFVSPEPSEPQVSSHSNMGSAFMNSMPSQPLASSHSSMCSSVFGNSVPLHPGVSPHSNMGSSVFANSVPSQPRVSTPPNMGSSVFGNSAPSQPRVSSHSKTGISVFANSVPSQPRVSSQPNISSHFVNSVLPPQLSSNVNLGRNFDTFVTSEPQVSSQGNMGSSFGNSVPSEPRLSSQPNVDSSFGNSTPDEPQLSSQPSVDSSFGNSTPSEPQLSSQPNICSSFQYPVPLQHQVYNHTIPTASDRQYGFQQGYEVLNAVNPSFSDFDAGWVASKGQGNHLPFSDFEAGWVASKSSGGNHLPFPDNSQVQSAGQTSHPPVVTEFDCHIPESINPGSLDFQFDRWVLENQSASGALEVSVPSGLNIYSPGSTPLDADYLLDF